VSRHNKGKRRRRPKSTAPQVPPRAPRRTQPTLEERPKAPWHPFPLVELSVLIGIVCIGIGFFSRDNPLGRTVLALGFVLGALGGLDTAAREHFSGYRSHTLVLAGFPAVAAAVLSALAGVPNVLIPILLVGVFMVAFVALRRAWERSAAG
jgi:uncharacterized membrane protein